MHTALHCTPIEDVHAYSTWCTPARTIFSPAASLGCRGRGWICRHSPLTPEYLTWWSGSGLHGGNARALHATRTVEKPRAGGESLQPTGTSTVGVHVRRRSTAGPSGSPELHAWLWCVRRSFWSARSSLAAARCVAPNRRTIRSIRSMHACLKHPIQPPIRRQAFVRANSRAHRACACAWWGGRLACVVTSWPAPGGGRWPARAQRGHRPAGREEATPTSSFSAARCCVLMLACCMEAGRKACRRSYVRRKAP